MNGQFLILRAIYDRPTISQRDLAKKYFISLGKVNQILKELTDNNLLEGIAHYQVTKKGEELLNSNKVDCAVILATDFGIKINPNEDNLSRAFIEINNEKLIERQISQLIEVGIKDIIIIIGYQKEKYDYLIDKYNVKLVYDNEYNQKSTLSSLYKIVNYVKGKNCYICPSNIYMKKNQFNSYECEPYYCAKYVEGITKKRYPDTTVQNEILGIILGGKDSYCMCGFAYFTREFCDKIMYLIKRYYDMPQTDNFTWEEVLMRNLTILPAMYIYKKEHDDIVEFDTLDDLRIFDDSYYGKGKFPIEYIAQSLQVDSNDIKNILIYDIGITYNYWLFDVNNDEYINKRMLLRVPNNEELDVDYKNENSFYKNKTMADNIIYFDEKTGIKISFNNENLKQIDTIDQNNNKEIINYFIDFHNLDIKYKLNNVSVITLFEKYEKLVKSKNVKFGFVDFDICFDKCKTVISKIKDYKSNQKLIDLHLYDNNIVIDNDNNLQLREYDCIGMGDVIDHISNICAKQNYDIKECEEIFNAYIKSDTKKELKDLHDKNAIHIFLYKLAVMAMLNVLYIAYKETETMYDTEDFQMKQYRLFKTIITHLENKKLL